MRELPKIISVDDHVVEPAHVWNTWLPERFRECGPRVIRQKWAPFIHKPGARYENTVDPEGTEGDAWLYEDRLIYVQKTFVAIPQSATPDGIEGWFDRTKMQMIATTYDEMRPGCWDPHERVKDFEANHMDGSLPFPTFPRFCGQTFMDGNDKEPGLACVRAYNDWMIEEWCAPTNGMNIPLCIIPLWDPVLAVEEVKRVSAKGVHAICFSEIPTKLGLPSIHTDHWDPLFQICNDNAVTLCMHIGSFFVHAGCLTGRTRSGGFGAAVQQCVRLIDRLAFQWEDAAVSTSQAGLQRGSDRVDSLCARARRHRVGHPGLVEPRQGHAERSPFNPVLRQGVRVLHR